MMHRHIFGLTDPRILVDHRDHDGLNNQRHNLRVCNHSQNAANSRKTRQPTKSQYKGVSGGDWVAEITVEGQTLSLGTFKSEIEAAEAYNLAAHKHFGDFSCLNHIDLNGRCTVSPMQQGVLSGKAIQSAVESGEILINPFNPKHLNPASYDLTLGEGITVYDGFRSAEDRLHNYLDPKRINPTTSFKMGPEGYILQPGVGYLMHTQESVGTDKYVPAIDGKSSIGRLFVFVHVTAGLGDSGFHGQYTLEVLTTYPIRLYPGMRICQVRFFTVVGEIDLYKGHYQGDTALGAVASLSHEQFGDQ